MRSSLFAATAIAAALALPPLVVQAAPNAATMNPTGNATGATNPNNTANPNGTDNAASQNNNGSTAAPSPNNNQAPGAAASNNAPRSNRQARNVIRSSLERAGFTNISVRPMAFVARATDRNGHLVLMAFRPHSFHAVTLLSRRNPNGTSGNGNPNGTSGNESNNAR